MANYRKKYYVVTMKDGKITQSTEYTNVRKAGRNARELQMFLDEHEIKETVHIITKNNPLWKQEVSEIAIR